MLPVSWVETEGKDAAAEAVCDEPFSWLFWVLGCVADCVGGLGFAALDAVAGGVDMPFGIVSAAGDAMLGCMYGCAEEVVL